MTGKWISTKRGRLSAAAGGVAVTAAIVFVALASGDSDSASSGEVSEVSTSAESKAAPEEDTSIPDRPAVPNSNPTPPEIDGAATTASLETVPVDTVAVMDPIALDETGDFGTGLAVRLVEIDAIDGEARVQGEIAGPALRVQVEVTNNSDTPIYLERTLVEVTYGNDRSPGLLLTGSGATPFANSIAPGESSTSTVVYGVPVDQRSIVQVAVTQTTGTPIVVFEGSAP
jgi:hypothetical protein